MTDNYRTRYNGSKAADRMRQLRLERSAQLQAHGWQGDMRDIVAALEKGPLQGWQIVSRRPCIVCGLPTEIARMYEVHGWILLQPVCIKHNQ